MHLDPRDLGTSGDAPEGMSDEEAEFEALDPREAARMRRRDHDAGAERRALMRPGTGKVFKQILDRQARDGDEPPPRHHRHRS
jgi:hypothetical protein